MHTYIEFCERYMYGKINVLDYMSLRHSLPKEWKTYVMKLDTDNFVDESVMPSSHLVNLINSDKGCKHVYWLLINTKLNG